MLSAMPRKKSNLPNFREDVVIHARCPRCSAMHQVSGPSSPLMVTCHCRATFVAVAGEEPEGHIFRDRTRKRGGIRKST